MPAYSAVRNTAGRLHIAAGGLRAGFSRDNLLFVSSIAEDRLTLRVRPTFSDLRQERPRADPIHFFMVKIDSDIL